jgi:LPXTG-motif cell wall-anchored protein
VRLVVDGEATSGRRAGQLFFVSTFGSAAGTILTSFYLVLWYEVNSILLSLMGFSVLLSASGVLAGRRRA